MAMNQTCDGVRRRDFLKAGFLGGCGLTLADYFRLVEAGEPVRSGRATSAIFVNLAGGPSHMDTFDLKPNAPKEFRGEFNPVATNVSGIEICEHLPKLAKCSDKFTLIRGVSHSLAAHEFGTKYMNTGNRPIPSLEFPGYGAVVSKELSGPRDLPPFVAVPDSPQVAGYLGVEYSPFRTTSTPKAGQPFSVRGITLSGGVTVAEIEKRRHLLDDLDATFRGFEKTSDVVNGLDKFSRRAYDIISSPRSRKAFDVSKEPKSITDLFNTSPIAQSCLLASRLVESGVRFVTVSSGGWDTHDTAFDRLKSKLLPDLDSALSGLFLSLESKGLLGTTSVYVTGEFGRTPKINPPPAATITPAPCPP